MHDRPHMEFDAPAMDHHTLMIPRRDDEAQLLYDLESRFAKHDPFRATRPPTPTWRKSPWP